MVLGWNGGDVRNLCGVGDGVMIRRPSTFSDLYAWHRAALRDPDITRHDGFPECGWFKLRMVRGGPWVPARIWCEQVTDPVTGDLIEPERLRAEVDGLDRDPLAIWTYVTPVSKAEFDAITDRLLRIPGLIDTMTPIDLTREAMRP